VTCPTLLIRGQASELLTPDGATALLGELPNAEFAEIPGAGHHVQLEQPAAVLGALQRFLEPLV
jgi:pimeloyl-ACP methyl ester carboxylesterase